MSKKSNTNAPIAVIASKIKTKQNDIKILYICDVIHGLARPYQVMQQLSTIRQHDRMKLTRVDTAAKTFLVLVSLHLPHQGHQSLLRQIKIGNCVLAIYKKCTSLENAIMRRNFLGPIISGSI